jgi:hypothetical protein
MLNRFLNSFGTLRIVGLRSAYWYGIYRFQCLSGISRWRTPAASWDEIIARLPRTSLFFDPSVVPDFFFNNSRTLSESLERVWPQTEIDLNSELANIQRGSFRLWEDARHNLGFPPEWNRNPLTGRSEPADKHWSAIDEQATGDIKGLWELSRFACAFRLAREYARTGDERAPDTFWQLVESWLAANASNMGPQWISSQEVALRAMAWIFALRTFAHSPTTTPTRVERLIAALDAHARRIEATLAYAKAQNNNHLISEAAGLFTIGLMFPKLPGAAHWESKGRSLLESTTGQFFPDGGYIQHSINYQRLALQLYLWAMRLAEINSRPFSPAMYACVDRSLELLSRPVDRRSGRMPNFGHNDGALFLPLSDCEYEDYRPLLQTLSLWRRGARIWTAGPWDEDAVWMLGPDAIECAARLSAEENAASETKLSAPRAGLFTLSGRESRAVIRCARFHERPAHADQLQVDLWWRGENLACDAGSYLYGGDPPWRNALTHAAVHNTVTVDGLDQMTRAGRFGWATRAQCQGSIIGEGKWRGTHDGYARIGVTHNRTVESLENDVWIITDEVSGAGSHSARLHWLIPDFPWEKSEPKPNPKLQKELSERMPGWKSLTGNGWRFQTPAGEVILQIWSNSNAPWNIYRAGELISGLPEEKGPVAAETRGWQSLRYANKVPALSLAVPSAGKLPIQYLSIWTLLQQ